MAYIPCLHVAVAVILCVGLVQSAMVKIDENSNECGSAITIDDSTDYTINVAGNVPGTNCSVTFKGQHKDHCRGLCYQILGGSYFTDAKVSVVLTAGHHTKTLGIDSAMQFTPVCLGGDEEISVAITETSDYLYDERNPGYTFKLDVFSKCGVRGKNTSISFDEAVKSIKGFHHGEEFHRKVKGNYVSGILLGFGLSSIFLVLLLITYCYYKHSPNRGASRSVGLPSVNFQKKKMKVNKPPERAPEPNAQYTAKDPDNIELGRVPESKPLLNSANADADYVKPPPVDGENGPTEVVTEPAKIFTSSDSLKGDNKESSKGDEQGDKSCDSSAKDGDAGENAE